MVNTGNGDRMLNKTTRFMKYTEKAAMYIRQARNRLSKPRCGPLYSLNKHNAIKAQQGTFYYSNILWSNAGCKSTPNFEIARNSPIPAHQTNSNMIAFWVKLALYC